MKGSIFRNLIIFIFFILFGCSDEKYDFGKVKAPTDLKIITSIKGLAAAKPNGDGSGKVTFNAEAKDAITYKFVYGLEKKMFPSGEYTHTFDKSGINKYKVQILAIGMGGLSINKYHTVNVYYKGKPTSPPVSSPSPPDRDASKYISIFSNKYTDKTGSNFFPDWGQGNNGSSASYHDLKGDKMLKYTKLSYQGLVFASSIDVSGMKLHIDIWIADEKDIKTIDIYLKDGAGNEKFLRKKLKSQSWTSLDIPMSEFQKAGVKDLTTIELFKFEASKPWAKATVFIDNIYFYKD